MWLYYVRGTKLASHIDSPIIYLPETIKENTIYHVIPTQTNKNRIIFIEKKQLFFIKNSLYGSGYWTLIIDNLYIYIDYKNIDNLYIYRL